jgi:uncharacterized protein
MKSLTVEVLDEAIRRLIAAIEPDKIFLFGSHVWGTPHLQSDVDLMIIVPDGVSGHQLAVRGHIALVGMPFAKDLIVKSSKDFDLFRGVQGSLTHKVAHQGKLIYDRTKTVVDAAMAA